MHSLFVKGILITGLALATQNVMAFPHGPRCNSDTCCVQNNTPYGTCEKTSRGLTTRCIARGMWTTCAVVKCCND